MRTRCPIHQFRASSPKEEGLGKKEVAEGDTEEKTGITQGWLDASL